MSKADWDEVKETFNKKSSSILINFINSDETFLPNTKDLSPFEPTNQNFSAKQLNKSKPGNWIPLYHQKDLSNFFIQNKIFPIRSGQAEFFFYKNSIFFDLNKVQFEKVEPSQYQAIEDFIPLSLKVNFQRNENAYLNKALALGVINHFIGNNETILFEKEIKHKNHTRLLYGQFGKIKITEPMYFKTTKESKLIKEGFQFEIDLVLESKDEIIIFEAKMGDNDRDSFSLLQLYYPLIYFRKLIGKEKKIRTIFIDIVTNKQKENYKLVEFDFIDNCFDTFEVNNALTYSR